MNGKWKPLRISLAVACGAVVMALSTGTALAQRDCSKAPADMKEQCETRNKAEAKCGKLEGPDRRKCMRDELPRDCAKADNKANCEAEVAAHKASRSKSGNDYRACMDAKKVK